MRLVIDLQGAQGSSYARGIGRYSRELALAMVRQARGHEVVVAVSAAWPEPAAELIELFSGLLPRAQIKMWHPPSGVAELGESTALRDATERLRARFFASLKPDLVHVTSLFEGAGDDTVTGYPSDLELLPMVATCYDLIPLIRKDAYFENASGFFGSARWYYRRLHQLSRLDGLLAISESSRQEAIDYLGVSSDSVFNINAGVGPAFKPLLLSDLDRLRILVRYNIQPGFILFLGAGDLRKNEAGLIAAYARLPEQLRTDHQLVIVGRMSPESLHQQARELGLREDNFRIVPFVSEADLPALYSLCELFVFPSLHEGFGLPAAEAMACGAPVIASSTSSLREVVGRDDATFDPRNFDEIAQRMKSVLQSRSFRDELRAHGPIQAGQFTWPNSAHRAWDALEIIAAKRSEADRLRTRTLGRRVSLAFCSPFPPQPTGIADYSHELVVALSHFYDITLVTEAVVSDMYLAANFPILTPGEFLQASADFDRVVYQVGNSSMHRFQVSDLIAQCPGIVVLHDAFLSDLYMWLAYESGHPAAFRTNLYRLHGYRALVDEAQMGALALLKIYPMSRDMLDNSLLVVVHSQHASDVMAKAFGNACRLQIEIVPLLRQSWAPIPRDQARRRLGIADDVFLVGSFGQVTPQKLPDRLQRAWMNAAGGRKDNIGTLVFVGEDEGNLCADSERGPAEIVTVGRVTADTYRLWLAACDIAIQLRAGSRGETSAAIADCLAAGLPVIANAHGSVDELPHGLVVLLPDRFTDTQLEQAIASLWHAPEQRWRLSKDGRAFVAEHLAARKVAARHHAIIEAAYGEGCRAEPEALRRELSTIGAGLTSDEKERLGRGVARSFPLRSTKQLLVDISELARVDSGSGIQRVVHEVGRRLLRDLVGGWRAEAVRFNGGQLRYARDAATRMLSVPPLELTEAPVAVTAGDILLCLDLNLEMNEYERLDLARIQQSGVQVVLVVYDLLPLTRPNLFPDIIAGLVLDWYTSMLALADGVVCISQAIADEVKTYLDSGAVARSRKLPIGWFHLGSDFLPRSHTEAQGSSIAGALSAGAGRPTLLVVGTVEPRKGLPDALDALDRLWAANEDVNLVMVGKRGWKMDGFCVGLTAHPEYAHRLFWLERVTDSDLATLYASCSGLLIVSEAEGFGLPIIEAARHGLKLILRDIPVFREIAKDRAFYFSGGPEPLAERLAEWLILYREGRAPEPTGIRVLSWDESSKALSRIVVEGEWQDAWHPAGAACNASVR